MTQHLSSFQGNSNELYKWGGSLGMWVLGTDPYPLTEQSILSHLFSPSPSLLMPLSTQAHKTEAQALVKFMVKENKEAKWTKMKQTSMMITTFLTEKALKKRGNQISVSLSSLSSPRGLWKCTKLQLGQVISIHSKTNIPSWKQTLYNQILRMTYSETANQLQTRPMLSAQHIAFQLISQKPRFAF